MSEASDRDDPDSLAARLDKIVHVCAARTCCVVETPRALATHAGKNTCGAPGSRRAISRMVMGRGG